MELKSSIYVKAVFLDGDVFPRYYEALWERGEEIIERTRFDSQAAAEAHVEAMLEQFPQACACVGCCVYGRCLRNAEPLYAASTGDLGLSAAPAVKIPLWEKELARRWLRSRALDDLAQEALDAGCEVGRVARAKDIVREGGLERAESLYGTAIEYETDVFGNEDRSRLRAVCSCPDSRNGRERRCKHAIAAIMLHKLNQRVSPDRIA